MHISELNCYCTNEHGLSIASDHSWKSCQSYILCVLICANTSLTVTTNRKDTIHCDINTIVIMSDTRVWHESISAQCINFLSLSKQKFILCGSLTTVIPFVQYTKILWLPVTTSEWYPFIANIYVVICLLIFHVGVICEVMPGQECYVKKSRFSAVVDLPLPECSKIKISTMTNVRQERIIRVQHGGVIYAFRHTCRCSRVAPL